MLRLCAVFLALALATTMRINHGSSQKPRWKLRAYAPTSRIQIQKVVGPTGSPFAGRSLTVQVNPFQQKVQFLTPLFHPNIDKEGYLKFARSPNSGYTASQLLNIAKTMLANPDLKKHNIVNSRAATMYQAQPAAYFRIAKASAS